MSIEDTPFKVQKEEKRMLIRRAIVTFAAVLSLSLCLPQAMSVANAASVAPAAGASARATTSVTNTAPTGSFSITPSISWKECSSETTTWVDIDIVNMAAGLISDWCFGGKGTWTFNAGLNYWISYFCSGNNEGYFAYDDPNGNYHSFSFGPGKLIAFPAGTKPVSLKITGWRGVDTCLS